MTNLFKAFLFKLKRDLTFRITLFVGLGLAILMTLIYLAIDLMMKASASNPDEYQFMFCTGQNLFVASLSPAQNFGIAIPVNLISFTVLEFSHGTIRNKIIAGNSKVKIYLSLLISGLIFTFSLIIAYSCLCLGLGSIFGGFDINGFMSSGYCNVEYFTKIVVLAIFAYIFITALTIFFATLFRSIGPSIPVVILLIMGMYLLSTIFGTFSGYENETFNNICEFLKIINPLHTLGTAGSVLTVGSNLEIANDAFIAEIVNNIIYSALFVVGGVLIFRKRDIK